MTNSFKILLSKSDYKRVYNFYNSIKKSSINLTDHWSKRINDNLNSFKFRDNEIFYFEVGNSGLSDNYKTLIDKNFKPRTNFKKMIKGKIMNYLKLKNGEAFNPKKSFLTSNYNSPANINFIINEFGSKQNDFIIYKSAYVFNEMNYYIDFDNPINHKIIEIGSGTGCLARIIKVLRKKSSICLVDLNTSIIYSIVNLLKRFPNSKYILPNEIRHNTNLEIDNYDFIFLTPELVNVIPESYFSLGINTMSFQEMSQNEIIKYFNLLRKILTKNNHFYCLNAVEKIMKYGSNKEYIRFSEYPWMQKDEDLVYRLSDVHKDMTTKPFFMKITKLSRD